MTKEFYVSPHCCIKIKNNQSINISGYLLLTNIFYAYQVGFGQINFSQIR